MEAARTDSVRRMLDEWERRRRDHGFKRAVVEEQARGDVGDQGNGHGHGNGNHVDGDSDDSDDDDDDDDDEEDD